MVDLHTHSTASDGTYSPKELVRLAKETGLKGLALTDHDTLAGLKEAFEEAKKLELPFLCGIEISVKYEKEGHFHLLGYFLTPDIPEIEGVLKRLQEARKKRNQKVVEKLQALGVDITYEELLKMGEGEIGRPHIARLLFEKGVVKSIQEAFEKYLKKGAPAYVPKALLTPEEAISLILKGKGIPVLAHPITLKLSEEELIAYLKELKKLGLKGIEAYYTEHTSDFTNFLLSCAEELGFLITGGSDFHGANKPDIKIGIGFGNLKIPDECFYNLKKAIQRMGEQA